MVDRTILNGKYLNLYVWYDNEYGYSYHVIKLMEKLANYV